jgi:CAAX protease family protein
MPTTSSPTSSRPSTGARPLAVAAWLGIAGGIVALGFAGRASDETLDNVFYDYDFAVSTLVVYSLLVGITFWVASSYGGPFEALGLRGRFSWRWAWIALGLIVVALIVASALEPFLHGGREQGFEPDRWRPDRAFAFAVNGLVAATIVPFAEELFFRGLGVRVLRFLGSVSAIAVTSLAFALGHAVLGALPPLLFFGAALAWVRLRSDSVWPGIIAHGFYNGFAVLITFATLQ